MAKRKIVDMGIPMLVLITIVGLIVGSYLSLLVGMIPGDYVVVKELFTSNFLPISIGYPNPISVDIGAIKFQFGIEMKFNLMSILGVIAALYFYRNYR